MAPKKAREPKPLKEPQVIPKAWEPALLEAPIEEEQWRTAIYFTVGEKIENELFLAALATAISVPLRKLFSVISWEGTMKQVVEFGNPKGKRPSELPMFYEVTEVAWETLAKGEELSLLQLSEIVKFQILCLKQKDLQKKGNENKGTVEEEAAVPASANKKKPDKKSAGKGKGKPERRSPEPPASRRNTKLLKRGEVEVIDRSIKEAKASKHNSLPPRKCPFVQLQKSGDEPDDGPQRYIIIQGFQNLQFLLMLGELGINISAVIMISYEKNESFLKVDAVESEVDHHESLEGIEPEKKQKEDANKSLENFWKYLEPVLSSGKPGSKLFDIARLRYTVKEAILPQDWDNDDMKLDFGAAIFDDIAYMIYDCEDWKRQHQNYLHNIKLITVPKILKKEELLSTTTLTNRRKSTSASLTVAREKGVSIPPLDMRYYNDLMNLVPLESLSVPLILHCILEQVVATEESLTPPSELIPKPRKDGLDQNLVEHMISTVLSLSVPEDDKKGTILPAEHWARKLQQRPFSGLPTGCHGLCESPTAGFPTPSADFWQEYHTVSAIQSLEKKIIEEFKEPPEKPMNESSTRTSFQELGEQAAETEEGNLQIRNVFMTEGNPQPVGEGSEPRADVQKSVLEKEQQIMIEELKKSEQKRSYEETKQPLLLNLHDNLTWRTHHLKILQGFDSAKVEQEMMKKLPLEKFLNFTHPVPETDAKRLASIQELMYHCTNENVTNSEVESAFKQFVFESMKFTKVKESGELEEKKDVSNERSQSAHIPWDNPVRFAKEMKRILSAKKTQKKSNNVCAEGAETCPFKFGSGKPRKNSVYSMEPSCAVHFEDTSEMVDEKTRKYSLTDDGDKKGKDDNLKIDVKYIQRLQLRSLTEWCFAEQHDPFVLIQVLQEAIQFYRCVDTYHYKQDNSILLVLHNPMNKQRQCNQSWETALHSNVGFRNYLEYVASSISDWVDKEEVKYQAELAAKELESLKLPRISSDTFPEPIPTGYDKQKKGKDGSASRAHMSIAGLPIKTEIEEEEEKNNGSFIREGSLKAWKKDQERLKEEEQKKQEKKGKKERPVSKKKEESVHQLESKSSRLSKRSLKMESKAVKEEQGSSSEIEPEAQQATVEPVKKFYQFTGYNFGNDLIRISGEVKSLFPVDGGHIRVKIIQVLHGSTVIQVCVMKDRHQFYTYIKDPIKILDDSGEDPSEKARSEISETEEEKPHESICKFRSFSAVLDDGITVTLSKHPPAKELKKVAEDSVLADILKIPPIHVFTPVPEPTTPVTAKSDKSAKNKNSQSGKGKQKKESGTISPPEESEQPKEEVKVELEEIEPGAPSEDGLEQPMFLCLNARSPDGLLITYFTEECIGIRNEDLAEERILLRQSYPIKTKGLQACEAARKWPAMQEASRVITFQGTVVKYMMNGSTEILFADGTVSRSPDSGPVSIPQPPTPASNQTDLVDQESKDEKELKIDQTEEGSKKGKHSQRGNSTPTINERSPMQMHRQPEIQPGTWITTTPIGLSIGTKGTEKLDIKSILVYKATDPETGEVMITRQDKVVTVFGSDSTIVEHADGTRITTCFQDTPNSDYEVQYEAEKNPHDVTRHVKFIKIECVGFATVIMNWEDYTFSTVFGNGTTIIAKPHGMYQIFPASFGCLLIDRDGCAVYTSETNDIILAHPIISNMELLPGAYFMRNTSQVICEVMDPEENHFQVMVDGNTLVFTHDGSQEGEEEDAVPQNQITKQEPVTYKKHAPRFFVLHADGSGTELLRSSEVEDYLYQAYSNSATAVLKEQLPELPGVLGITFLQSSTEDIGSRWLIKKEVANIVPRNLRSRKWDTFPQVEHKKPGPPVGIHPMDLHMEQVDTSPPPVLKCPSVLEVRQLFQYEPINTEMQQRLQNCLKKYIELSLQKEQELNEMVPKEPRDEEEREHAADLLKLTRSAPDNEVCQMEDKEANKVDVASIYEDAVGSTFKNASEVSPCEWTNVNEERQELDEAKGTKLALKNMLVPSYFQSDVSKAIDSGQELDLDCLSKPFPTSQKMKGQDTFDHLASASPHTDTDVGNSFKTSDNSTQQAVISQSQHSTEGPVPAYATRTDRCNLKRSDNPTQQTVISQYQHSTEACIVDLNLSSAITGLFSSITKHRSNDSYRQTHRMPPYAIGTDTCNFRSSDNTVQQAKISQYQYSPPGTLHNGKPSSKTERSTEAETNPLLQRADEQDLSSQKTHNCCFLHKPLSIPVEVLKDIGSRNGVVEYRPEELPGDGNNIIFNKSLIIDAANQPRKEKVKLPTAILSSKPGVLPNQRFAIIEEQVRRKVNTVSIAGPIAGGIFTKPTRGFELFPAKVNFGVLQEGFTYSYNVLLKNVGIDTCRFRVKQPPPSTGLRVCYKPGPVAAGLATELEIELYAIAIDLESTEGAGYLCHHLEIQTETDELYLPIIATVLTENVYKNRTEEYPKGGKAEGVRLNSTDPTSRMDIIRHRKPPTEAPVGAYVMCGT
ncbi:sperm-associated antigen 17 [Mustelus asterias]